MSSFSRSNSKPITKVKVGQSSTLKWRCSICKYLNPPDIQICKTCHEEYTDDDIKSMMEGSNINNSSNETHSTSATSTEQKSKPSHSLNSKSTNSISSKSVLPPAKPFKTQPYHKNNIPAPKKGGNIKSITHSRLNQDTVAYRGHFNKQQGPAKIDGMSKAHIVSMKDLTRNGFQSSSKSLSKSQPIDHNERPVTPPPKHGKKQNTLSKLQNMASGMNTMPCHKKK